MKTSFKTRIGALATSIFVTVVAVDLIANHAYPNSAPVLLASAAS